MMFESNARERVLRLSCEPFELTHIELVVDTMGGQQGWVVAAFGDLSLANYDQLIGSSNRA
jgi:hypothetical protein